MKWRTLMMGGALVACAACGGNADTSQPADREMTSTTAGSAANGSATAEGQQPTGAAAASAQQAVFEGCVQRGGGILSNELLLTMMSEPAGSAGLSGSVTKSGSSVEREQMRMAARTYRLRATGPVELDELVGKQVRLTATIGEAADLPNGNGGIGTSGDSQKPNRSTSDRLDQNPQLSVADLGRLDVQRAEVTGEACGSLGRETSGRTNDKMAGTERVPRSNR